MINVARYLLKLHRHIWLWLGLSFFCAYSVAQDGRGLRYNLSASSSWHPYYMKDRRKPGILGELVPMILAKAKIKAKHIDMPPKRTVQALQKGILDFDIISPSWFAKGQFPSGYILSKSLLSMTSHLVVLAKNKGQLRSLADLSGKSVGTVRGYFYHDTERFLRVDYLSERELLLALKKSRISVVIMGKPPARYWSNKLNVAIEIGPEYAQGDLHIRLKQKHLNLLPALNQAITKLKTQGVVDSIIARYIKQ